MSNSAEKHSVRRLSIRVTAESNPGGRRYMEDYMTFQMTCNLPQPRYPQLGEQVFMGIFDGHGGKEAAKHTRDRLWEVLQDQPKFLGTDIKSIKESLSDAYLAVHKEMEPLRATWRKHRTGDLSTAGTTASTVLLRDDHMFVAHVGDSTAVLAVNNPMSSQHPVKAVVLTRDHKPEDVEEILHIQELGGDVMRSKKGTPRVIWERERSGGGCDKIPFLGVARSLGDFWSFNKRTKKFTVSPKPDVSVHKIEPKNMKFLVIASDGLWNVMAPDEVVRFIWDYQNESKKSDEAETRDVVKALIKEALQRWGKKCLPADNIAILICFISEAIMTGNDSAASFLNSSVAAAGKSLEDDDDTTIDTIFNSPDALMNGTDSTAVAAEGVSLEDKDDDDTTTIDIIFNSPDAIMNGTDSTAVAAEGKSLEDKDDDDTTIDTIFNSPDAIMTGTDSTLLTSSVKSIVAAEGDGLGDKDNDAITIDTIFNSPDATITEIDSASVPAKESAEGEILEDNGNDNSFDTVTNSQVLTGNDSAAESAEGETLEDNSNDNSIDTITNSRVATMTGNTFAAESAEAKALEDKGNHNSADAIFDLSDATITGSNSTAVTKESAVGESLEDRGDGVSVDTSSPIMEGLSHSKHDAIEDGSTPVLERTPTRFKRPSAIDFSDFVLSSKRLKYDSSSPIHENPSAVISNGKSEKLVELGERPKLFTQRKRCNSNDLSSDLIPPKRFKALSSTICPVIYFGKEAERIVEESEMEDSGVHSDGVHSDDADTNDLTGVAAQ